MIRKDVQRCPECKHPVLDEDVFVCKKCNFIFDEYHYRWQSTTQKTSDWWPLSEGC